MYVLNLYENMKVICMEQDCITIDVWIFIYKNETFKHILCSGLLVSSLPWRSHSWWIKDEWNWSQIVRDIPIHKINLVLYMIKRINNCKLQITKNYRTQCTKIKDCHKIHVCSPKHWISSYSYNHTLVSI